MKRRLSKISFALLFMLANTLHVFCQQITFKKVLPPEGKFSPMVTCITQDTNGLMWFASPYGLYSYDGYHFTFYVHDRLNPNSLVSSYVESVYADTGGIIWAGTFGAGLDRFDPATGIFTHFHHEANNPESLINDTVSVILIDSQGILWIGTYGGLDKMDPKKNTFIHYRNNAADPGSISHNVIQAIYEDRQGTLWIGTGTPFLEDDRSGPEKGGLNRMNIKTGKFTRYMHDPGNIHSLANNKMKAIFEDDQGVLWIGTAGNTLHKMDRQQGTFERIVYDPTDPEKLSGPPLQKRSLPVEQITFFTQDAAGGYWIGTIEEGLNYYNPKIGKIIRYNGTDNVSGGFTEKGAWRAFTSRDGMLWISSNWGGGILYRIDPFRREFIHYTIPGRDIAFYEEANGIFWTAGEELKRSDFEKGIIKRYNIINPNTDFIGIIKEDWKGRIWVGTSVGLKLWNKEKDNFTTYKNNPGNDSSLSNNNVNTIYADCDSNLWIGTYWGLNLWNSKTGSFTRFFINPKDSSRTGQNAATAILRDKTGKLWIGTWGAGINLLNPKIKNFKTYLMGIRVSCLFEDSDGVLWLGADNGLYTFDRKTDTFLRYKASRSFIDIPDVSRMVEDNQKYLWLQTSDGMMSINPRRDEAMNYGISKTLFDYNNFCYKGRDGKLYFTEPGGYYSFYPANFTGHVKPPEIIITSFRVADKLIKPANQGPLKENLSHAKEIRLPYYQNVFSFEFTAIDYTNPEFNRHFFMLENYDNSWHPAGSDRKAYYFNIPPGEYIFHVKATNSIGAWAEKSMIIIITQPWWKTWWAYCLFGLLLMAALFGAYQIQKRRLLLAERARNRVTELEMEALRAQMNPHFIFNSLNSINWFIQQNNRAKASEYLTKFSKLVRLILQNSKSSLIPLESELESLALYLDLEGLRFDHHFSYHITIPPGMEIALLKVPPLIIQPYVENAIWHGLMHKEEKGRLGIVVCEEGDQLLFKISDNGIGRKQAAALGSKSATKHKSMGMEITSERIAKLQRPGKKESSVNIYDHFQTDGTARGTEVIIKIPVIYD